MKNLFAALCIVSALFVNAQNQNSIMDKKYVEVSGVAEMEVVPNEIYINITLQEEKEGLKRSVEDQEAILITKLKKVNVDIKNLKLSNVGSYTYWDKKNKESYKQKSFELKLEDAGKASEVMYELNTLSLYRMNVGRTEHSDIEKFKKEVKINAVIAAKEKATYLLEAVNEEVGDVIYIIEQANNYYGGYRAMGVSNMAAMSEDAGYNPNPDVEFKPIMIQYNILARFEIK